LHRRVASRTGKVNKTLSLRGIHQTQRLFGQLAACCPSLVTHRFIINKVLTRVPDKSGGPTLLSGRFFDLFTGLDDFPSLGGTAPNRLIRCRVVLPVDPRIGRGPLPCGKREPKIRNHQGRWVMT